jgi:hypothetical protein
MRGGLVVALALLGGCAECASEIRSGLVVRVEDDRGRPQCDAFVEAQRRDEHWRLSDDGTCSYALLNDGSFTIVVHVFGYWTEVLVVDVPEDGCRSHTEPRVVRLRCMERERDCNVNM